MSVVCEFCSNEFMTLNSMKSHQKRTKYCIKIQSEQKTASEEPTNTYIEYFNLDDNNQLILQNKIKHINSTLVLNNIEIQVRPEDGYINLTQLNKAGGKEFSNYIQNNKTKAFLDVLSSSLKLSRDQLVKYESGPIHKRATWAHPQVAINNAQWISPEFDVQVSNWIFDKNERLTEENNRLNSLIKSSTHVEPQLLEYKLTLGDKSEMIIPVRSDGMINATVLCKAANKLFATYRQNKQTEAYLQALSFKIGIPIEELIRSNVGGNHSGTWVHRKVAYNLAQWCDPNFAVQVSDWLDELLLTGQLQTENEKSSKELDTYYKDQLSVEKIKYNEIEVKYERMLKPAIANKYSDKDIRENIEEMRVNLLRSLPSIFVGCHVYAAVIDIQIKDDVLVVLYKVGFTTDVNERFKQHKKSYPMFIPIAIIPVSSIKIESEVHASIPSELRVKYNNEREIYQYDDLPSKFVEYICEIVKVKDVQNKDNIIENLKYTNKLQEKDIQILELESAKNIQEKDMKILELENKTKIQEVLLSDKDKDIIILQLQHQIELLKLK